MEKKENKLLLITIIYNNVKYWGMPSEDAFFYWLKKIKAVKNYEGFHPSELHVYIDPKKIDYMQLLSLYGLFVTYRVKGREQLEQLLPYLPKSDSEAFDKYFFKPWKNRTLKNKNKNE